MSSYVALDDHQLASLIKAEDMEAYKVLFFRYHERLVKFLWTRVYSEEVAKDLAQEVFIKIWGKKDQIKPSQSIKSYLFRIGVNLSIDYHRKKAVEQRCLNTCAEAAKNQNNESNPPELQSEVNRLLSQMPEPVRTVFLLSRYEYFKNKEIAELLGISVKTVESRLSRALAALRAGLFAEA